MKLNIITEDRKQIKLSEMSISQIADLISTEWQKVNYTAKPYLSAMHSLESASDSFGYDSGKSVILYFLANASSWRGDVAKEIKAELKRRTK